MSDPIQLQVKLALVNARVALQNNNKMEARRWASHAARLDPNSEEAWLIMGAVSSPAASLAFIQRALEINPQSDRAIKGMQWALKRLQEPANQPGCTCPPFLKARHPTSQGQQAGCSKQPIKTGI